MSTTLPTTGVGDAVAPTGQWTAAPNGALTLIGAGTQDNAWGGVTTNTTGDYDQGWKLNAVPSDFGNILTCAVQIRFGWAAAQGLSTWPNLDARIVSGATILAAANSSGDFQSVATNITTTTATNSSVISFSHVNTSANKAAWDDAVLEIRIGRVRDMGGSTIEQRVYATQITGTYSGIVGSSFTLSAFRYYGDDATTATPLFDQNVNAVIRPYRAFRLRFGIDQTVSDANTNLTRSFKIQYNVNGGVFADLPAQSDGTVPTRFSSSAFVSDGAATSARLTGLGGTFIAGLVKTNNTDVTITFSNEALSHTELEFVVEIYGGSFLRDDVIGFRIVFSDGNVLNNVTVTPELRRRQRKIILG